MTGPAHSISVHTAAARQRKDRLHLLMPNGTRALAVGDFTQGGIKVPSGCTVERVELDAAFPATPSITAQVERAIAGTQEPPAGAIDDPLLRRGELTKVLYDFRDGILDGVDEAVERILEVTGRD